MEENIEVREGGARLLLPPADRSERGPESKETAAVFYNPAMGLNRDLSSLLVASRAKEGWNVLDGLAASGARGLRYAVESPVPLQVEWNDWNPLAVRLLEQNARLNGLEPRVTLRNLNALLWERVWHMVDVDPYGSPAPFLDAATHAVRDHGLVGLTATDTTALAGVFPKPCRRRYHAEPLHGELGHEVALRILVGAAVRAAARHEVALTPVLAHATDHYYRVMMAARRGAGRADKALEGLGHVFRCPACGERGLCEERIPCPACGARVLLAGPLWTGPLLDAPTLDAMRARADAGHPLARADESLALLARLRDEAEAPALFYDLHEAGRRARTGSAPVARALELLAQQGHRAWGVHFNRLAIRTTANEREVRAAVAQAAKEAVR